MCRKHGTCTKLVVSTSSIGFKSSSFCGTHSFELTMHLIRAHIQSVVKFIMPILHIRDMFHCCVIIFFPLRPNVFHVNAFESLVAI